MGATHHRCSVLLMKARQETTRPAAMLDAIRTFSLGNLQSARAVHEAAAHCMTSQQHVKFLKRAVNWGQHACLSATTPAAGNRNSDGSMRTMMTSEIKVPLCPASLCMTTMAAT